MDVPEVRPDQLRERIDALLFHGLIDPRNGEDSEMLDILDAVIAGEQLDAHQQARYEHELPLLLHLLEEAEATARLLSFLEKDA